VGEKIGENLAADQRFIRKRFRKPALRPVKTAARPPIAGIATVAEAAIIAPKGNLGIVGSKGTLVPLRHVLISFWY